MDSIPIEHLGRSYNTKVLRLQSRDSNLPVMMDLKENLEFPVLVYADNLNPIAGIGDL